MVLGLGTLTDSQYVEPYADRVRVQAPTRCRALLKCGTPRGPENWK